MVMQVDAQLANVFGLSFINYPFFSLFQIPTFASLPPSLLFYCSLVYKLSFLFANFLPLDPTTL